MPSLYIRKIFLLKGLYINFTFFFLQSSFTIPPTTECLESVSLFSNHPPTTFPRGHRQDFFFFWNLSTQRRFLFLPLTLFHQCLFLSILELSYRWRCKEIKLYAIYIYIWVPSLFTQMPYFLLPTFTRLLYKKEKVNEGTLDTIETLIKNM